MIPLSSGEDRPYPWITLIGPMIPPDTTVDWTKKGRNYDLLMARYYASKVSNTRIDWFRLQYAINSAFARGAWGMNEDRITFLKDGPKDTTRKELSMPIIQPMVLRLCGQASAISISAKATAVTQYATSRREMDQNRAAAYAIAAQVGPNTKQWVQNTTGYGTDPFQNRMWSEKNYTDKETQVANSIMTMQERHNNYAGIRSGYANVLSCSGLFSMECIREGMELNWRWIHPYDIAWDTNTPRPDLNGEFVITVPFQTVGQIASRYAARKDVVQQLTEYASIVGGNVNAGMPNGQYRVMTVYYKDKQWTKMGYVMENGAPKLVALDIPDVKTMEVKYTSEQVIPPPPGVDTEGWSGNTHSSFIQVTRYCTFIPWEYTAAGNPQQGNPWSEQRMKAGDTMDLVLESGVCELQDINPERPSRVGFPIKLHTVQYLDGYVIAPITAAVAPQRVMNQVVSDLVWRMSKAGNMSTIFDSRALANSNMTIEEINYAQKEGNAYELDGSMSPGGIAGAVTTKDTSLPQSFYQLWNVPQMIDQIAQKGTGLPDSTMGQSSGQNQLVGTTQLLLQQSNTMMQPFTNCWVEGFRQVHQYDVQAGKGFFVKYPWILAELTGDEGVATVMQSMSMQLEQFRADIEASLDSTAVKAAADEMLLKFYELKLVDASTVASLGGRSYPEDVWNGARTSTAMAAEAAAAQAEAQQKQAALAGLTAEAKDLQRRQDDAYAQAWDLMGKQIGADQKAYQPFVQGAADAMFAPQQGTAAPAATPGT